MATYFRKLKPSGKHRSYRFQQQEDGGKWTTVHNEAIDALNAELRSGVSLSQRDIDARAENILASLYAERDKEDLALLLPGNMKQFEAWWAKTYPPKKQRQYSPSYLPSERHYMLRALKAAGNEAVDGPLEPLQDWLDEELEDDPDKHNTVCGRLNRIRRWLKLPLLTPMRRERRDVSYLTRTEVEHIIRSVPDPLSTLYAVAFYTGMRRGELFALDVNKVVGDVVEVRWQMHSTGGLRLPKNGKIRKAFIIPGGEVWVERWKGLLPSVKYGMNVGGKIRELSGKRFHDLRHSYAVYLIGQGLSLDWVAQSLGNSRDVCERHYASHILQQDSIELMRAALKKFQL